MSDEPKQPMAQGGRRVALPGVCGREEEWE